MPKRNSVALLSAAIALIFAGVTIPILGVAAVVVIAVVLICWRKPKRAFALWIISLAFLPVWLSTAGAASISASSLLGLLCVVCTGLGPVKPHKIDFVVAFMVIIAAVGAVFAGSPAGEMSNIIFMWVANYVTARVLGAHIGVATAGKIFAVVMSVVGILAVVEFLFSWHPYTNLLVQNLLYEIWSPIQQRGGVQRSEWAFGHSIALGASLALAAPFAATMRASALARTLCIASLIGGVAVTFSRSALISMVLSTLLVVLFSRTITSGIRLAVTAIAGLAAFIIAPSILAVFTTAGDEVTNSGDYRGDLLSTIPFMNWIGISPVVQIAPSGFRSYGRFISIDSALISVGLDFGIAVAAVLAILFLVPIVRTLLRRANVAEIALVGQLPVVLTAAFITQWQGLLWMAAGLAVSAADWQGPRNPKNGDQQFHSIAKIGDSRMVLK